ncbi:MAG: glycosyltransferase family 1 protein [Gemmatimonadaceae bacterium]
MRIGLNLLPVVPGIGGAWHYIANLLAALAAHDRENDYVGLVSAASASLLPGGRNITAVRAPLRASWRPLRIAYENTVFPRVARGLRLDCVHHFFGTQPLVTREPTVVSVFDAMVFARPGDFPPSKRLYLQRMRRKAARHASVIAPMSRSTAAALHEWLDVPDDRMIVIPTALGPQFGPKLSADVDAFRAQHDLPELFWLCVTGSYAHKNVAGLIDAYALLHRRLPDGWRLIIRGRPTDDIAGRIMTHRLEDRVRFLPPLGDAEMPLLYASAGALIFPSLYEGGGIPVMEAMVSGCPVVASDLPTTREFAGDAALRFDASNDADMARAMEECERSPAMRSRLIKSGYERATEFSSERVAAACIDAYRHAVAIGVR